MPTKPTEAGPSAIHEPRVCTFDEVCEARANVYRHLEPTPLHGCAGLSELLGADVHLKHENHHAIGVFKVRGGVNLAAILSREGTHRALYSASTGNHGQSMAFAGRVSGIPVRIAIPEGGNPLKIGAMRRLGARVDLHGRDFDEAREWITEQARADRARYVGPTDHELIAGVGTCAMEIMEKLPDVDVIIVPVGGGSGAAAAALVARTINPNVRVIAVQSERAPAVQRSWKAGHPVSAEMRTAAEGLATRVAFRNTLDMMRDERTGIDDFLLVSDEAMALGVRLLLEHARTLVELAGAAALAAAMQIRARIKGARVVLMLSGGNISPEQLKRILD